MTKEPWYLFYLLNEIEALPIIVNASFQAIKREDNEEVDGVDLEDIIMIS